MRNAAQVSLVSGVLHLGIRGSAIDLLTKGPIANEAKDLAIDYAAENIYEQIQDVLNEKQ
ncbi:MAG: hypothetical protein K0S74_1519 [Chlamydiales bacterium]|nr:hypothetical protein [Chlamydiales bacterium]